MERLAAAFTAAGGSVILAGCVIQKVPARWNPYLRVLCSTPGWGSAKWLLRRVAQAWHQRRFVTTGCYQVNIVSVGAVHKGFRRVHTKTCR